MKRVQFTVPAIQTNTGEIVLDPLTVIKLLDRLTEEEAWQLVTYCEQAPEAAYAVRASEWLMKRFDMKVSAPQVH